jgi:hypothetical protein
MWAMKGSRDRADISPRPDEGSEPEGAPRRETRLTRWWLLVDRLKDRKVVQWTLGYLGATWLILQAMDVLSDIWGWSLAAQQVVCLTLALGLPPAVVIAWCHGEQGRQKMTLPEALVLGCLFLASAAVLWGAGDSLDTGESALGPDPKHAVGLERCEAVDAETSILDLISLAPAGVTSFRLQDARPS